jgi:hypothetical protein
MDKDQIAKGFCYAVATLCCFYLFFQVLPYLIIFLVVYGAWHLFQDHEQSKRHNHRHNCHRNRRCNRRWWLF